ncbi:MAG: cation-translocating P-type ATPase [Phototrophicaceae bacterium]
MINTPDTVSVPDTMLHNATTADLYYQKTAQQVADNLQVDPATGLSDSDISTRLKQYGTNEITDKGTTSIWTLVYAQIAEPLVIILLLAAGLSAVLGKIPEFIAISAIVILNAILGVFQEYRAEQAIEALKKMSQPNVRVRRNGKSIEIEATQLVPGDVILLETGNVVPADARLLDANNLRVQEASLTGESYAVDKINKPLEGDNLPLGDRKNMLYMGTNIAYGRGEAIVTGTGMQTELGKVADMLQNVVNDKSPLQKRMSELGQIMFYAAFVVMAIAFVIGFATGQDFQTVLLNGVAIAVAVVPEGLPAVVTISLALGAQRMLSRRALIRKLPAVETLGSVTVIASDKTGTLTENKMTVKVIDVAGNTVNADKPIQTDAVAAAPQDPQQHLLLVASALANDSYFQDGELIGDPTEGAMLIAAKNYNLERNALEATYPRVAEVPFSSERKRMTTVHRSDGKTLGVLDDAAQSFIAFTKGAPDGLLDSCNRVYADGEIQPLTDEWRSRIEISNNKLAGDGLRVLGVSFNSVDSYDEDNVEAIEDNMVFIGLVGMIDPPRPEVIEAVATCRTAGIRPVMITGDHPMTALAIAKEIGIAGEGAEVMTGRELAVINDEELRQRVGTVSVYARVAPEHKLRIVQALRDTGNVVAMTGDGVNDAPALKQADIGVAMGITGTDVSKQASDMVITDDNFATIVQAAEEGRAIYDNVRRFVKYLLASNTGELFVLLAAQLVSGMTIPLTTLQILWMNLITDGIPALALGLEKAEDDAMKRPPYAPNESILGRGLGRHIILIGGTLGISALALGVWAFQNNILATNGNPAWNTMVFMMLTLAQMGHALGLRSHSKSLFSMNPFSNRILVGAVVSTLILQLMAIYLPFFNNLFGTNPLTLGQLGICLALSTLIFWVVELEKLLVRRGILS